METTNLRHLRPSAPRRVREALQASHGQDVTFFLGTVRPDGTPHAAGIGAIRADDI